MIDNLQNDIREALDKATPTPWKYEKIGYIGNTGWTEEWVVIGIAREVYEENDAHLIVNAPTWLLHQQELIVQLQRQVKELTISLKQETGGADENTQYADYVVKCAMDRANLL